MVTSIKHKTRRRQGRDLSVSMALRRAHPVTLTFSEDTRSETPLAPSQAHHRRRRGRPRLGAHAITYDDGKEFASHVEIATSLRSLSYFAKPYHSWERGLNEHTNGLFRQYFPKGSDLSIMSDADVQRVEDKLNSRPRKILGYRTPREVFFNAKNLPVALRC
jgi:IS30 family transposase